jgi:hypothetical protein
MFEFFNLMAPNPALLALDKHKELRDFGLYDSAVDLKFLSQRKFIKTLRALFVADEQGCDPLIEAFKGSKNIESVTLESCTVSSSSLKCLTTCPNLKILRIEGTPVDTAALEALAAIKSLKRLKLMDVQLLPEQLEILSRCRFIEHIELTIGNWPPDKYKQLKHALPQAALYLPSPKAKVLPSDI